jgi:hypothetical protein
MVAFELLVHDLVLQKRSTAVTCHRFAATYDGQLQATSVLAQLVSTVRRTGLQESASKEKAAVLKN